MDKIFTETEKWPWRRWSEFEIQAEAYIRLKDAIGSRQCRGEYRVPKKDGKKGARFDIVILNENLVPVLVIEVKRASYGMPPKCLIRYSELAGCKAICIRGMDEAKNILEIVKNALG
jgi:hypothetical protein